jgi:tetratricopeptide (TPR) repeat protein
MKKFLILVCLVLSAGTVFGQKPVEYILKAKAFTEGGQPDRAISLLSEAMIDLNDYKLYIQRAESKIIIGDYSGAIADYNESNRMTSFSGEYGLARIYSLKSDPATALYHLELNLGSVFRKGEKEIFLDPAFGAIENRQEWRQFWKKDHYSTLEKGISEIEYYVSNGKLSNAADILTHLRGSNPGADEIYYGEAMLNLSSGKYSEAINSITVLLNKDQENEKYLRILAEAQVKVSNHSGASVTFGRLLDSGVADAGLLLRRAECYIKNGEITKAMSDIDAFLEMYPSDKYAIRMAGKVANASGDNIRALEYYSKNLKLHPNDPECYADRANAYLMSKSWDLALNDYAMALDLNPADSEVWLNKGIALLNTGKVKDACHDFRKAMSLGNKKASGYISKNCIK